MNTVAESPLKRAGSLAKNPRLARWLRVHRDGTVSVYSGKVEIGQGILTALAQIAAEAPRRVWGYRPRICGSRTAPFRQ